MLLLRQPNGTPEYIDLGVIGLDSDVQMEEEARTVVHPLNNGSYVIDVTGREPMRWSLMGNCITRAVSMPSADGRQDVWPQNEFAAFSRLMGRWVEVQYYNAPLLGYVAPYEGPAGTAVVKNVRAVGYTVWAMNCCTRTGRRNSSSPTRRRRRRRTLPWRGRLRRTRMARSRR